MDIKNNEVNLENEYRKFLEKQVKSNGEKYEKSTIDLYIRVFDFIYFKEMLKNIKIYNISDLKTFTKIKNKIISSMNDNKEIPNSNKRNMISSLKLYEKFLTEKESQSSTQNSDKSNKNDTHRKEPHQRIFFGAPGTGKSYLLNEEAKEYFEKECCERVTFHPNYMYGNFVGAFKPFPKKIDEQKSITYKYIPGVLIRQLIEAYKNENINYLLIIEEINRANVAAVFGDIFQLLDRDINGENEYEITTSRELQKFLKKELKEVELSENIKNKLGNHFSKIFLPSNLYIWATMNSAD